MMIARVVICCVLLLSVAPARAATMPTHASGSDDSLIGTRAPDFVIDEWINAKTHTLRGLRGKVVVVEFFQMACPACAQFSIPLMKRWSQTTFVDEPDIVFLSVHTVFEGHRYQTANRLQQFVRDHDIFHPVGIDHHRQGDPVPMTMRRYKTGGTPCLVIIDQDSVVRYKQLGSFQSKPVEDFLWQLLKQ